MQERKKKSRRGKEINLSLDTFKTFTFAKRACLSPTESSARVHRFAVLSEKAATGDFLSRSFGPTEKRGKSS